MDPVFPPELERLIFETAGHLHRAMIPTFLLVARRIQIWYRFKFSGLTIANTPLTVFKGVRHLSLDSPSSLSLADARKLLALCNGLLGFAAIGSYAESGLLSTLAQIQTRRLVIDLFQLFETRPVDLGLSLFSHVTHLDLLGDSDSRIYSQLPRLPALTHLCLNGDIEEGVFHDLLSTCVALQLLVNLWSEGQRDITQQRAYDTPFVDPRFVVGVFAAYWVDWQAGAYGRRDFWAAAEDFVAQKRRGEIPDEVYWMGVHSPEDLAWTRNRPVTTLDWHGLDVDSLSIFEPLVLPQLTSLEMCEGCSTSLFRLYEQSKFSLHCLCLVFFHVPFPPFSAFLRSMPSLTSLELRMSLPISNELLELLTYDALKPLLPQLERLTLCDYAQKVRIYTTGGTVVKTDVQTAWRAISDRVIKLVEAGLKFSYDCK
ncbi:hypothetical protein B0H16DRAFT_1458072 [Mycena metata]|uniref:Uncharacterized protein n=1 Tax=Mycena metata TaxID=1033252 RepID=A0AAD7NEN4_9AGAR|nr:hypothetical protein B0H16DRAFT_1458072 [Mycena metata]